MMLEITVRAYAGEADLHALIDFLVKARARNPVQRWHVGDLIWRRFYSSLFDPTQNVQLWLDEQGNMLGFGWFYPPNTADLHSADPALFPQMIAWAQAWATEQTLYIVTLDTNTAEIATLEAQGFAAEPAYGLHLRRRLDREIPRSILPAGFTVRPLAGDSEAEQRALLHQKAFNSKNVTVDGYRNVIRAPLYQPDLDLVVVAPDGCLVSFCLCWLDSANRVGLFEPVGTHPDYRRLGLARAVMLEGLRRMQAYGMESVLIASGAENEASKALYAQLGFDVVESHEFVYARQRA